MFFFIRMKKISNILITGESQWFQNEEKLYICLSPCIIYNTYV